MTDDATDTRTSPRVLYFHPYVGPGRATIAVERTETGFRFGVACCSPRDQFQRARGRLIAEGRMRTPGCALGGVYVGDLPKENTAAHIHDLVVELVRQLDHRPRWSEDRCETT